MKAVRMALALACLGLVGGGVAGQVNKGDKAPAFEAKDETGKVFKSSDVVGKKIVVLYFYPADFTGGCTKQACSFRDDFGKLADKDVVVLGVSGDTPETHAKFKKEHNLPFTLLADEKGEVAKKFGVPVKVGAAKAKVNIGGQSTEVERGATISRWTIVIGKDGTIIHKNEKVNAAEDSKSILNLVK
jgi:peroxiredoxin Q/BCP